MKKVAISLVALMVLVLSLFTGCTVGSGTSNMSIETNTSTKLQMKYDYFDGYKKTTIKVEEGKPVEVKVDIKSDEGKISAYIAKDNDKKNAAYQGDDIKTSNFTVTLSKPGTYTLRVDTDHHKGSYCFDWGK